MQEPLSKHVRIGLFAFVVVLLCGFGIYVATRKEVPAPIIVPEKQVELPKVNRRIIGTSVEGRDIEVYSFGGGAKHIVFIGGVHGGYEWNSAMLAFRFIDYLTADEERIPSSLTIDIVPSANPDGLYKVTGKAGRFTEADVSTDEGVLASGRFNAHGVDLNRNFDCKWQPKSLWRSKVVSAGTSVFSEPESLAIKSFILETRPVATVFWHSQSNGVYASQCGSGIPSETLELMSLYSSASGYKAVETFNAYETTGAADDWMASVNLPAITVELKTHETIEWNENLAGIKALLEQYGN